MRTGSDVEVIMLMLVPAYISKTAASSVELRSILGRGRKVSRKSEYSQCSGKDKLRQQCRLATDMRQAPLQPLEAEIIFDKFGADI